VSPEISSRPRRRTFTVQDKLRILAETDRAADTGRIGAILRREGLYSSILGDWRRQREAGAIGALAPARRGPKIAELNPLAAELARSRKDNARLTLRLAKATAFLLSDLGVTRSHNRPHVSNDNPFSESHFKTLKYQPRFPKCFGCIEDARSFCSGFFDWYNQEHHHGGIGLMTPDQVHYGQVDAVHAARQLTLDEAFRQSPERFVKRPPVPPAKPSAAWINPPQPKSQT
jgi:transposase-like protein